MGTEYTIVCHDCKEMQDMHKWRKFFAVLSQREAMEVADTPRDYQSALAVSFLCLHNGHRIEVGTDVDDGFRARIIRYREKIGFFSSIPTPNPA